MFFVWLDHLAVRTWPDNLIARRLRRRLTRVASRLIWGAIAGLMVGLLAACLGIFLSDVDLNDAATLRQMRNMVALFAVGGAVILAFVFDFTYLYFHFLRRQEGIWTEKFLRKRGVIGADQIREPIKVDEHDL